MNKRSHYLVPFALIGLVVAAPACNGGQASLPEDILMPPLTGTPGGPEAFPGFKEEMYFFPGGGGEDFCMMPPPPKADLPAIMGDVYPSIGEDVSLCLFGFPLNEEITVELYTPDGEYAGAGVFPAEGWREVDGVTAVKVTIWVPASLPAGEWYAVAQSASAYAEGPFEIAFREQMISTVPEGDINPFEDHACDDYRADEWVVIHGARFEPNMDVPLAIYYETQDFNEDRWPVGVLVYSEMVTTDSQGNFQTMVGIKPSAPPGVYAVVFITKDPDADTYFPVESACFMVP